MADSVQVKVPATTGNLGSGYDCIGMALSLHNDIRMEQCDEGLSIAVEGEGAGEVPKNADNVCIKSANRVFDEIGWHPPGLSVRMIHAIPVSRGLGSSGVAIVAGAVAANELAGNPLSQEDLMRICSELEGHPDNVVPSLLGGLSVSGERHGRIVYQTHPIDDRLKAIVAIPDFTLDTKTARKVLPAHVPMEDAVFNLCSAGLLISSLITGNYENLREGMADRLHQPFRAPLIPGLTDVISAALEAGAHGAALSGAGPTAIALAETSFEAIGKAMSSAFDKHDISCRIRILDIDNSGCQVITS